MSTVNPYSSISNSLQNTSSAIKKNTLDQSEFLKLMTTQMTHQDPTKPMDNGEFVSQMAQIGTVSGIQDLQQSFSNFSTSISSDQSLQAAGLVGRNVSVASDFGVLPAGGDINGNFSLATSSATTNVIISDPNTDEIIKTIPLDSQSAGTIPFKWDGTNDNGVMVNPGLYKIRAEALIDNANTAIQPNIMSKVDSVTMGNNATGVQVNIAGLGAMSFNKIKEIL